MQFDHCEHSFACRVTEEPQGQSIALIAKSLLQAMVSGALGANGLKKTPKLYINVQFRGAYARGYAKLIGSFV